MFGLGEVVSAWSKDFNFLAVCGESRVVKIYDRQGNNKIEMPLKNTAKVIGLDWDMDSESVAILQVSSLSNPVEVVYHHCLDPWNQECD
jgi:WD40 repeat protein